MSIYKYILLILLILFCPVFVTDFMVGAGFAPVSYILFYSILWFDPIMIIYVAECLMYVLLFNKLLSLLLPANCTQIRVYLITGVIASGMIVLSILPIHSRISHGDTHQYSLRKLFVHEHNNWQLNLNRKNTGR